jgi:OOP family OmpA-OmpF porin
MPISRKFLMPVAFVAAALLCVGGASLAVRAVEGRSGAAVRTAFAVEGLDWADAQADGLLIRLSGMAETEADRFRALSVAGTVVDAQRIIDAMEVRPTAQIRPPDFSVEVLRNDDGISLIGLIPAAEDRERVVTALAALAGDGGVSDMLETADYPVPEGWDAALEYGLEALAKLPRSKISITPSRVTITAITSSGAERARLEAELSRAAPPGLRLTLELSAPRPVITPFTLRFLIDANGARFDACSADTEGGRTRILAAAVAAGADGRSLCTIGLGVPSHRWTEAIEAGIAALAELGAGSLTFSDADVSLVAADSVAPADFDRVVGEFERALPDAFSVTAVLTSKPEADGQGPPEFSAQLMEDGQIRMFGRLTDETVRGIVDSFAAARFGSGNLYNATRLDPDLPDGWPVRVLAALESLAELQRGGVIVRPDFVRIEGETGNSNANAEVARILAEKLGEGALFEIAVTYVEALDPVAALPTPEECAASVNAILGEEKITFSPGSAEIEAAALDTIDKIAGALADCGEARMEIGAHSDSQGGEDMNLTLSQRRADSVLNALMARRVLTSNLTARGYGESVPIADNDSEEGRERNRRIEFTLIDAGSTLDTAEATAPGGEAAPEEGGASAEGETAEPRPAPTAEQRPRPRPEG